MFPTRAFSLIPSSLLSRPRPACYATYRPASNMLWWLLTGRQVIKGYGADSAKECETDMHDAGSAPRRDTRAQAQQVALELFAEQGYEKTSLREIAERLGVTKAALYYHFKSKEDIVHSFTDDYFAELDALLDWAKDKPRGDGTCREVLDRYVGIVLASNEVFRFLEQNRASVQSMDAGKERFARVRIRLDALVEVLVGQDAPLRDRVRAT